MQGVRFTCQPSCTKCCEVTGYVYLTKDDLRRAAAFVNISVKQFERRYVVRFKRLLRLRKPKVGQCYFLKDGGCSIHPAKPTQCRLYPFWPELVEDRGKWTLEAKSCPGIGKGELIQLGTACETASEMKRAYPSMY